MKEVSWLIFLSSEQSLLAVGCDSSSHPARPTGLTRVTGLTRAAGDRPDEGGRLDETDRLDEGGRLCAGPVYRSPRTTQHPCAGDVMAMDMAW